MTISNIERDTRERKKTNKNTYLSDGGGVNYLFLCDFSYVKNKPNFGRHKLHSLLLLTLRQTPSQIDIFTQRDKIIGTPYDYDPVHGAQTAASEMTTGGGREAYLSDGGGVSYQFLFFF